MPTVSARMDGTAPLECSMVSWPDLPRRGALACAVRHAIHGALIDRHGFVKFKHWRFYGERGLAGEDVSVWVYDGNLKVSYQATTPPCMSFPSKKIPARSPK